MIVRCVDNTLQRGVLVLGREYEVHAERDDCYILSGFDKGFSKTRFGIVSNRPCQPQRRGDRPSRDTLSNDDFSATAFGAGCVKTRTFMVEQARQIGSSSLS
jgi:hypothetical protein